MSDRRPMSAETTRSAPDVIIVSKPIRWGWPLGPPPWAPTPPDYWDPGERTCPEGAFHPCYHEKNDNFSRSMTFDQCGGYYSKYFDEGPKLTYDYCLKSDFYKSRTLPRNLGSSVDCKKVQRSVCFVDDSPCKRHRTFVVTADIEAPR